MTHTTASVDFPIVVEIVDTQGRLELFRASIDGAIHDGLATVEKATVRFYRTRPAEKEGAAG